MYNGKQNRKDLFGTETTAGGPAMKDFDFGYFGTGDEGYAQYMTAFDRNFGGEDTDSAFASDDDGACGDADAEDGDPF